MRVLLIFLFLTSHSFALDIFEPKEDEKDIIGFYTLSCQGLPKKFKKIWKLTKFSPERGTIRINGPKLDVSSKGNPFLWNIYVPKSYRADFTSGLIILSTNVLITQIPEQWKRLCEEQNYILIAPDFSNNRRFTLEASYAAMELIKARYKINLKDITFFALSKNIRPLFYIHSAPELNAIIALNTDLSWGSNQFTDYIKIEKFLPQLLDSIRNKPLTLVAFDRLNGNKPDQFQQDMLSESKFFKKQNFTKIIHQNFQIEAPDPVKVKEKIQMVNGGSIVVEREEDGNYHKLIFEKIPYESLVKIFNFKQEIELAQKEEMFKQAATYEKNQRLGLALTLYERIHRKYKDEKAFTNIKNLAQRLNNDITEVKELFDKKEFPASQEKANKVLELFGPNLTKDLTPILEAFSKDKAIVKELKAAEYLKKVELSLKNQKTPKSKIIKACKDIIAYTPNTLTAQKAQAIMEKFK